MEFIDESSHRDGLRLDLFPHFSKENRIRGFITPKVAKLLGCGGLKTASGIEIILRACTHYCEVIFNCKPRRFSDWVRKIGMSEVEGSD